MPTFLKSCKMAECSGGFQQTVSFDTASLRGVLHADLLAPGAPRHSAPAVLVPTAGDNHGLV